MEPTTEQLDRFEEHHRMTTAPKFPPTCAAPEMTAEDWLRLARHYQRIACACLIQAMPEAGLKEMTERLIEMWKFHKGAEHA